MKILSLIKAVQDSSTGIADKGKTTGSLIPNPADISALETALQIRDKNGGSVSVLSMGPESCEGILRQCIARGADRAILLTDPAFAGADTAATSRTIAKAVEYEGGFDLIVCGIKSTDGETGQVGPQLAARLGIPSAVSCTGAELAENKVVYSCLTQSGSLIASMELPALLSFVYGINSPRLPSIVGLRKARRSEIICLDKEILKIKANLCGRQGSFTEVLNSEKKLFEKRKALRLDSNRMERATQIISIKAQESRR